ncbi:transmembrane protease serine 11G-like [Pelodytes ibericus]
MALMTERGEKDEDQQQKHKEPRQGCCITCCCCCTQCMSGFIFLLIIAGLVLCARYFLEFPVIINGFGKTINFTEQAVNAIIAESSSHGSSTSPQSHDHTCNTTYKVFVGSFQLLNESCQVQYNDTSSPSFQRDASRIHTMLNKIFNDSLLKSPYINASVFSISPDLFTVQVQLLFSDDSTVNVVNADSVAQVLKASSRNAESFNISINTASVVVGAVAACPPSMDQSQSQPWQSVIQQSQTTICMGNLLSAFWVLTTSSCVSNRELSSLTVILSANISPNRIWTVAKIIQHPNFTASPLTNNIALILLSCPVFFSSTILPICLPQSLQDPTLGTVCNITNGNILNAPSTSGSITVAGTVTSGTTCLSKSQDGIIYISLTSKASLIQVDIGTSLICTNTNKVLYFQGIASSQQNSTGLDCLNYISIGHYSEWIKSYILA